MKSLSLLSLLLLTILALTLFHPSHSAPLPVSSSRSPYSSSPLARHLLSRNDSRRTDEERIENSNEQQARDMQDEYKRDQQQQQQEINDEQSKRQHTHSARSGRSVDRDAVVTGDDLEHPRDPKQQQKQQQQVINNGTTTPPPSEQRQDRRDDEADRAKQADDMNKSVQQAQDNVEHDEEEEQEAEEVDMDEITNGTNVTAQNNGSAPIAEHHPYNHNTQKPGTYNRTAATHHTAQGGHHNRTSNSTEGRLDQTSPYHSKDPQSRTWSQQQRVPGQAPANFTAPPPPNSTYPSSPPPYSGTQPQPQPQQPSQQPPSPYNGTGHDTPGSPQPVPTVDAAQRLVDKRSWSDVLLGGGSGSDADDEYDSRASSVQSSELQGTHNSTEQEQEEEDEQDEMENIAGDESSTGPAGNTTGQAVQEPGNAVQVNGRGERQPHHHEGADSDGGSNIPEDIRDAHNGGNRLRNEPRADRHHKGEDEEDPHAHSDKHNGRHHLNGELHAPHPHQSAVDVQDLEHAVTGGSWSAWLLLLVALCGVAFGVGWYVRRAQHQQKYEVVEQRGYDAYGDIVEDADSDSEFEQNRVQVRVY